MPYLASVNLLWRDKLIQGDRSSMPELISDFCCWLYKKVANNWRRYKVTEAYELRTKPLQEGSVE